MEQELYMTRLDWVEDSTQSVWYVWRTLKIVGSRRKKVFLNENSVEGKPCINREIKSLELTFSYTCVMMNMKLLAVVTPPSICQ